MARRSGGVHVATTTRVYKGRVYQTHLLRRTYREEGKVKHQTLGNLSHLPPDLIETIRRRLRGESSPDSRPWKIVRSFPHGHVAATLGTLKSVGLESILASRSCRESSLVIAMIVARSFNRRPSWRQRGCSRMRLQRQVWAWNSTWDGIESTSKSCMVRWTGSWSDRHALKTNSRGNTSPREPSFFMT